jgi:CspA family cold shock protein
MTARQSGTIKKYNDDKGYGFIIPSERAPDVFFHISAFGRSRGPAVPSEGDHVQYDIEVGEKGPKAINVSFVL